MDSSLTSQAIPLDLDPSGSERRTRSVVLAGGQGLIRAARRSVLACLGLEVVADAADPLTAAKAAELHGAAVVLVDSEVAGGCVAAVRRIAERAPASAVLVVAQELDHETLLAAIQAGAEGYVSETLGAHGLARAVEVACGGETVIPRAGVAVLIDHVRGRAQEHASTNGMPVPLTRREVDVLTRLRAGLTPKQIAYELELSDVTVRRHLSSVTKKRRQARPLTLALESTS